MNQNRFNRGARVSAETARRITGFSTPFGGVQWADPGPSEREIVRGLILFLEGSRILDNPLTFEVRNQVDPSIDGIQDECTRLLRQLGERDYAALPVRAIREACRRFYDDADGGFRLFANARPYGLDPFFNDLATFQATMKEQLTLIAARYNLDVKSESDLAAAPLRAIQTACQRLNYDAEMAFRSFLDRGGFITALGSFRATVGQQVLFLAAHYNLDIEGPLADVLPRPDADES